MNSGSDLIKKVAQLQYPVGIWFERKETLDVITLAYLWLYNGEQVHDDDYRVTFILRSERFSLPQLSWAEVANVRESISRSFDERTAQLLKDYPLNYYMCPDSMVIGQLCYLKKHAEI